MAKKQKKKASRATTTTTTTAASRSSKAKPPSRAAKPSAARAAKTGSRPARRTGDDGLTLRTLSPVLTVNDVETSLAWYGNMLGFKVAERWEHEGKLVGAAIAAGQVSILLGQDDWQKGRDREKGQGVRLYCETSQDIDRLAAAIETRGGTLAQGPTDQPWGTRDLQIEDPDGFKITIAAEKQTRKR